MINCIHFTRINESIAACANAVDLVHNGTVPISLCRVCPFVTAPAVGFFAQTTQLLVQKARRGELNVALKPCGGCGSVKRRETDVMQFIWPYWHRGANDDEIRWSVRSVEKHFQGTAEVLIIGDKPPWYSGRYIPQRRVSKHTPNRPFRDMLSKVWTMATHPEVRDEFVWMMDDIYLIKPTTIEDLSTPRAVRWSESQSNSWQRRKANTMRALANTGRSVHDFATHLPHWVEKDKLRQLYEEFSLLRDTMLWEVLYGNVFRGHPEPVRPFFRRITRKISLEELQQTTEHASIFNHTASAWCPAVRTFLEQMFPNQAAAETSKPFVPTYKVTRNLTKPKVKRRPIETHRAYLENEKASNK